MSKEGKIWREGNRFIVEVKDSPDSLGTEGVVLVNPDAPMEERIYRKEFMNKVIFLPDQYDEAMKTLYNEAPFILSANGYSKLSKEWLNKYGIKAGAYEAVCRAILCSAIEQLRKTMPNARIFLIHGASDMGIDKTIIEIGGEKNIDRLGFSCPEYMLYVKDDGEKVYVAADREKYADAYIKSLDLLISTGGRKQALEHDISASIIHQKRIHFVDVPNLLSSGGVPATVKDNNGNIVIENAAAAFGKNISYFGIKEAAIRTLGSGDKFEALFENISQVATEVCREKMPPEKMFRF